MLEPGEGRAIHVPGRPLTFKVAAEGTGGAYSLFESGVAGTRPIQHIHETKEEAFYIKVDEQIVRGIVGSFVLISRRRAHIFWNAGPTPAKLLGIFSPPEFEQGFVEV